MKKFVKFSIKCILFVACLCLSVFLSLLLLDLHPDNPNESDFYEMVWFVVMSSWMGYAFYEGVKFLVVKFIDWITEK